MRRIHSTPTKIAIQLLNKGRSGQTIVVIIQKLVKKILASVGLCPPLNIH